MDASLVAHATGAAFDTDRRRTHIDHHATQPRTMQMLRAQNTLTTRAHTTSTGLEPRPTLIAVDRKDGLAKDA